MAQENRAGGIAGCKALANWGHEYAQSTIAAILRRHGIGASTRAKSKDWKEFLKRHWDFTVAVDFFAVEVWIRTGLTRFGAPDAVDGVFQRANAF